MVGRIEPSQGKPIEEQAFWASHSLFINATASTLLSEAFHAAKTFVFLAASLLKVKKLQPSPIKLVVHPEAKGGDLFQANSGKPTTARSQIAQLPPISGKASMGMKTFFFLAASLLKAESSNPFRKTTNSLGIAPLQREGCGFTYYLWKSSKGFSSQTRCPVNSRNSWLNSLCEALHDGVRSVALQRFTPKISEITDKQTSVRAHTHTHTQNTGINIKING